MTDVLEIEKQISAVFKTKENQEKYEKLILEREQLLKNQSSSEVNNLEREIGEIKNRQSNSGAKRYQLLQTINDKLDAVKIIEPQIEAAQRQLNQANLELSFFEQSVSQDRKNLKDLRKKLDELTGVKDDEQKFIS